MSKPRRSVFVYGRSYRVQEHAGYVKAFLNEQGGWSSVWAVDYTALVRRIKLALSGGQ